ncbi:EAL domain-containing protein [Rhizobium sp. FKL33]|uniref:putative bifunctional diguanylate cyclase/phosphodiesterase n=1 Tax=Rhizobium sp. FKL33 TaxID=2562307 RepID=UPI001FEE506F|nr:EAL domain-containing protein [Rhizobium sp. FKL33]
MIDDMPVAVMTVDPETFRITYVNQTSKELIDKIRHLLPEVPDDLIGASVDIFHRNPAHQRSILSHKDNLPHSARIKLGSEVLDLKISAITDDDGTYLGPMLTWAIVTKEVVAEEKIRQLAHHDPLTGLANRTTFNLQTNKALSEVTECSALMLLDLDGFKDINDTLGHTAGDRLLQEVARRLLSICTIQDATIGRIGGDEFAIIVPNSAPQEMESLATSVIAAIAKGYVIEDNHHVHIGVSIGIAYAPLHGKDYETLAKHADLALYSAKQDGKGAYRVFSASMEEKITEKNMLQAALRSALSDGNGLYVFYQPIVDVRTRKVCAREALVRWYLNDRGWISPSQFVPIAEESDLIDLLGEFVLNTACADAAAWTDGARVAVNVSPAQLGTGLICGKILTALAKSGLSPNRLEIEVTETALINDEVGGISDLRRIRNMGVRIALDDFGTGYSSLTNLCSFPFDKIKIDGSFVSTAINRDTSRAVVASVAELGRRLGVETVAEGVETQAHLDLVVGEGCSSVQGYLLGHPAPIAMNADQISKLVDTLGSVSASQTIEQ